MQTMAMITAEEQAQLDGYHVRVAKLLRWAEQETDPEMEMAHLIEARTVLEEYRAFRESLKTR